MQHRPRGRHPYSNPPASSLRVQKKNVYPIPCRISKFQTCLPLDRLPAGPIHERKVLTVVSFSNVVDQMHAKKKSKISPLFSRYFRENIMSKSSKRKALKKRQSNVGNLQNIIRISATILLSAFTDAPAMLEHLTNRHALVNITVQH
jgi:hypothetical protein